MRAPGTRWCGCCPRTGASSRSICAGTVRRKRRPTKRAPTGREMAADLNEWLAQRDLTDVVAAGHSMGGCICTIAAATGDRIESLALVDPVLFQSSRPDAADAARRTGCGGSQAAADLEQSEGDGGVVDGARRVHALAEGGSRELCSLWTDSDRSVGRMATRLRPGGRSVVLRARGDGRSVAGDGSGCAADADSQGGRATGPRLSDGSKTRPKCFPTRLRP